jgi:PAS domain S-box-containing protein
MLQAIFENSPAAILFKSPDGHYLKANQTWHEWFNPNAKEIIGKTVYDFY